jgi:hypothetical protein
MKALRLFGFLILFFAFLLNKSAFAQTNEELALRKIRFELAQEFFEDFIYLSNQPWQKETRHLKDKYKAMFKPGIQLYDEIIPEIGATAVVGKDTLRRFNLSAESRLPTRTVEELFGLYWQLFSKSESGHYLKYDYLNAAFNTEHLVDQNTIEIVFARNTEALINKAVGKGLLLNNRDTIRISVLLNPEAKEGEVKGVIQSFGRYERPNPSYMFVMTPPKKWLSCPGNKDCDLLLDEEDQCPDETGYDAEGCNSGMFVLGATANFGVYAGTTTFGTIPATSLAVNPEQTSSLVYRGISYPNKGTLLFKGGFEIDVFAFKYKNIGLGVGVFGLWNSRTELLGNVDSTNQYSYGWRSQEIKDPAKEYLQVVRFSQITEEITYRSFGIPILLKYNNTNARTKNKRVGYFIHAGPYLSFVVGTASGTGTADYEAYYGENPGTFTNASDALSNPGGSSWVINRDHVKNSANISASSTYYERKRTAGFNVAKSETKTGSSSFSRFGGLGLIVRVGGFQRLTRSSYLLVSAEMITGSLGKISSESRYVMSKNASDQSDFKPASGLVNSINGTYFGVTASYQIKFFKRKKSE